MDVEQNDESCVTIYFDSGENVRLNKSYLIKHSSYFEAMFSGKFIESQSGDQIQLKDINNGGFMSVIKCLKHDHIIYDSLEELLLILETSQLLQFTDISQKSIQLIQDRFLFTSHAIPIFSISFRLGLQELYEKARIYILYNFKIFLVQNRDSFFELTEGDFQLLLNDNHLNVDNETDVYDLVIDWCIETNNFDIEYEMVTSCVRFNSMKKYELQKCISKTNNLNLQNTIKGYLSYSNESEKSMELLIRPIRSVPNVLCAIKNEQDGHAFIYRWDWASLKFVKFLKLDPLPLDTTGYNVVIKDMDIYVLSGEIGYGKGTWNEEVWKYNLLTKQWTKLEGLMLSKRRHGVAHICGDKLFLIGGVSKHRLYNERIEKFNINKESGTLVQDKSYFCNSFEQKVFQIMYSSMEYKGNLVMVSKNQFPIWHELCLNKYKSTYHKWEKTSINVNGIIICAANYLDDILFLTYNYKYAIKLYHYCTESKSSRELKCFKTEYDDCTTMCAFNMNKVMVFGDNILEYYSFDNNVYKEYPIQINSFHSNHFYSIPIY